MSSGIVFGKEIPPIRIVPTDLTTINTSKSKHLEPFNDINLDGVKVTRGDLFGVMQEDSKIGYAPLENFESANGWWKSNNLGARRDVATEYKPDPGKLRTLLFGDSYTQGSRIRQGDSFAAVLEKLSPNTEYLNFGVDGYSTAQAYLRFKALKNSVLFDNIVLITVPTADLWRDISVSRYFGDRWVSYKFQPRFYLQGGELLLAKSPFSDLASQLKDGPGFFVSRAHLQRYDAFYFGEYEPSPLTDIFVTSRIAKAALASFKRKRLHRNIKDPASEAVQVTRAIIAAMKRDVVESGANFFVVVLPTFADILRHRSEAQFRREWGAMRGALCESVSCIYLMEDMDRFNIEEFDFGVDGSHYGTNANRLIAESLKMHFNVANVPAVSSTN